MSWFDKVEKLYDNNIKIDKGTGDLYKRFFKGPPSTPKNPGEVQRDSASKQSIKVQKNKAKWKPKATPKNPGEVQRDSASKQSMKTQTNKAKWKKGFIKTPKWKPYPHTGPKL